ncbi:MAG: hypothetical protein ACRDIY_09975, partial [Chloroflexota bacterium]
LMSRAGQLDVDPETDSSGARFVTCPSVQQCWLVRQSKTRSRRRAEPAVPIAEVARFTGESPRALMDLVRAGILEQVPGRRAVQLTAGPLRSLMASRDPGGTSAGTDSEDPGSELRPAADGTIVAFTPPTNRNETKARSEREL